MRIGVDAQDLRPGRDKLRYVPDDNVVEEFLLAADMVIKRPSSQSDGIANFGDADRLISLLCE